jgi:hypothetical protein
MSATSPRSGSDTRADHDIEAWRGLVEPRSCSIHCEGSDVFRIEQIVERDERREFGGAEGEGGLGAYVSARGAKWLSRSGRATLTI